MKKTKARSLITEISNILDLDINALLGKRALKKWPLNVSQNFNDIISTKIFSKENLVRLRIEMPPNKSLDLRWHDCLEKCTVVSGVLADQEQPLKKWKKGQVCIIEKMQKHKLYNPSSTEVLHLIVDFYF